MGAVYLATQTLVGRERHCVIKEMLDYVDPADPEAVRKAQQRFQEEAATLVELNHVGVPQIYDYFSEGGRNYIAMQFIEGESLEKRLSHEDEQGRWINGSPQPLEQVVRWGIQLCRVLEYLAGRNPPVIHRDIKPANIILNKATGQVCLVDFGTAKARLTMQPAGQMGLRKSSIYGTAGYAAPEMYPPRGESEPRSDVYALGATLYHLLTDDDPRDHPFKFPKLSSLPAGIRKVLEGALEVDVQQRLTATQMRQRLEAIETKAAPFHFRSGAVAHDIAELVELCDRHWEDAKFHFYKQDFENWLRTSLHRHDLVSKVLPIRQRGGDQDAGLEEFLHILDPALPPPAPDVSPSTLDFGSLEVGQTRKKTLRINNKAGRGHLSGHIVVDPSVTWLQIPDKFSGNALTIEATVDTSDQKEGSRLHTKIQIQTPYVPPVEIPVRAQVALAWRRLCLTLLTFVGAGALVSAGAAYLMAQAVLPNFSWTVSDSLVWGLGLVAALIGLIVGVWFGHGKGFSWKGCVLGGVLSYLLLGYAYYVLTLQFMILQRWGGDETAYLSFVLLGIWIGSVLGFYQGLRKARRKGWAAVVSALVVLVPIAMFWGTGVLNLRSAYIYLGDSEVPVPYVVFAGSEPVPPPPPTSTPILAAHTPKPTSPPRSSVPRPTRPRPTATPIRHPPTKTPTPEPYALVTAQTLNVRAGPGTEYDRIAQVKRKERLLIVGRDRGCDWFKVKTAGGKVGWVSVNYVDSSVSPCYPPMAPAPPTPTPRPAPLASNTRDFSGSQGANRWWYQVEQGRNSGVFVDFPRFGPYQSGDGKPPRNCWLTPQEQHVRICEGGEVHPGATGRIAYRWRSNVARNVRVVVHAHKIDTSCGNNDGVWIGIYRVPQGKPPVKVGEFSIRGAEYRDRPANTHRYDFSLSAGDSVMVMVDIRRITACDMTRLCIDIY